MMYSSKDTQASKMSQGSLDSRNSRSSASSASRESASTPTSGDDSPGHSAKGRRVFRTTKDTTGSMDSRRTGSSYNSGSYASSGSGGEGGKRKRKKDKRLKGQRSRTRSRSRSTKGSHSRSASSGSRSNSEEWSSSSSEDLMDQDLSLLDQSILPLHMREGAIRDKTAAFEHARGNRRRSLGGEEELQEDTEEEFVWVDNRSRLKIFLSRLLGEEGDIGAAEQKKADTIIMNHWQIAMRIYPCAAWSVVVMCLILLVLARYFTVIEPDGQSLVVLKNMLQTEVRISAALSPAFRVVSSLAFAARAGLLNANASSPYTSLSNIAGVGHEFEAGRHIEFVQVVGAAEDMALLRPGTIGNDTLPVTAMDRHLQVSSAIMQCKYMKQDPVRCLKLNNSVLIDVPRDGAAVRWQRPSFLTYAGSMPHWIFAGQRLDPELDVLALRIFAHRLVAYVNASSAMTASGGRGPLLAVEVAIDLKGVNAAIRSAVPEGGTTYLCTTSGTVIAGSNWLPEAASMYDPEEGMIIYPTLWDLGFAWADAVTPAMVAAGRQTEGWHGSDIVVTRPLAVGDPAGGSYRAGLADLRIVSMAPRRVGTSKDFKALVHGAMGVMGAPGVFLLLTLVVLAVHSWGIKCLTCMFLRIR